MLQWADILKDKSLQNLPYKIELDAKGRIIKTPASNQHGMYQSKISGLLLKLTHRGHVISECSIDTADGTKVADVVWASSEFFRKNRYQTPYKAAPEICVEIVSPSNQKLEIAEKITLYLAKSAQEVWICERGRMTFTDHSGRIAKSKLVARFPSKI